MMNNADLITDLLDIADLDDIDHDICTTAMLAAGCIGRLLEIIDDLKAEIERLRQQPSACERNEAREAARWLLEHTDLCHSEAEREAIERWPWLGEDSITFKGVKIHWDRRSHRKGEDE